MWCAGKLDADCPIWDHVVQLFVCCPGGPLPCDTCTSTLWLAQHHAGGRTPGNQLGLLAETLILNGRINCSASLGVQCICSGPLLALCNTDLHQLVKGTACS